MFGVSRFKDKVAVVAGAEHPLGASLCRRLAGFGALVVAVGRSEAALRDVARRDPKRIETLAIGAGRRDMLAILKDTWGDEPLNFYADFWPLDAAGRDVAPHEVFAQSAGLAAALLPGMRAGRAMSVMVVSDTARMADVPLKGVENIVGYEALLMRLASRAQPGRFVGLRLPQGVGTWTGADCVSAGDMVLTLFHPVSRGLKNGSIVDWSPEQA